MYERNGQCIEHKGRKKKRLNYHRFFESQKLYFSGQGIPLRVAFAVSKDFAT